MTSVQPLNPTRQWERTNSQELASDLYTHASVYTHTHTHAQGKKKQLNKKYFKELGRKKADFSKTKILSPYSVC